MMDLIHILHNTGVFGYRSWLLALFLVECMALVVAILWAVAYAIGLIVTKARRKQISRRVLLATTIILIGVVLVLPGVCAHFFYAEGYRNYLSANLEKSGHLYLKALRFSPSFKPPLEGLVAISMEREGDRLFNHEVVPLVLRSKRPDLCRTEAKICFDAGRYAEAVALYGRAHRISAYPGDALEKIKAFIPLGGYSNAETELQRLDHKTLLPQDLGLYYALVAQVALRNGRRAAAAEAIQRAVEAEPASAKHLVLSGQIHLRIGNDTKAIQDLERALTLRPDLPEAYFALGLHYYRLHERELARRSLEKAVYYDNNNRTAAVLLHCLKRNRFIPPEAIRFDQPSVVLGNTNDSALVCHVGETMNLEFQLVGTANGADLFVTALEPYGFGVLAEAEIKQNSSVLRGGNGVQVRVQLHARRPDSANLGRPWTITLVAGDVDQGVFVARRLTVSVREKKGEEGRILFVLTQDHEQTAGLRRRPGDRLSPPHLTADEARRELVEKLNFANELAQPHGVYWSHIIDIGSAVLRLKWAQSSHFSPEWREVWPTMRQALIQGKGSGHDVQLHIHGYNIPGNKFSRQYYDPASGSIRYEDNVPRVQGPGDTHRSWAENFTRFGTYNENDTRVGSIFQGIQVLEGELHEAYPAYRTLFFRAGEYEFGTNRSDVAASIQALRLNHILAGSNSHSGSPYRRNFKFFKPIGLNTYFTSSEDIDRSAGSLLDIGILEMLPVPDPNGHDHLSPLSALRSVQDNYERCLDQGAIRNGLFLMMEMYHLNTTNVRRDQDSCDRRYGDWAVMEDQFSRIRKACPKIECVTISDAVKIYLDHYAPDVIALRTREQKVSSAEYRYDIQFLGKDIEVSSIRPHYVTLKPPSYLVGSIARVEIRRGDDLIDAWDNVVDYVDLPFVIQGRDGYTLHVFLKE